MPIIQVCTEEWTTNGGKHSIGAEYYRKLYSQDQCKELCISDSLCIGVDFHFGVYPYECWVHRNKENLKNIYSNSNLNQFILIKRCSGNFEIFHFFQINFSLMILFLKVSR